MEPNFTVTFYFRLALLSRTSACWELRPDRGNRSEGQPIGRQSSFRYPVLVVLWHRHKGRAAIIIAQFSSLSSFLPNWSRRNYLHLKFINIPISRPVAGEDDADDDDELIPFDCALLENACVLRSTTPRKKVT